MSRSLLLFESAIKTEATKKQYTFYLKQFLTYAKLDDPDALLTLKDSTIQVMLGDSRYKKVCDTRLVYAS